MACRDMLIGVSVKDVMRPCTVFVGSDDLVTRVRARMRSMGIRSLPVIDLGKLSGIITVREVMQVTSTRSNITASGIMFPSRLMATPATELADLARQMVGLEISDVPVIQSRNDKTVVGIVKLDDILRRIAGKVPGNKPVGDLMVKDVVTCEPEDETTKIWKLMEEANCSSVPVVRYDKRRRVNKVLGMITRSDIIRSGAIRLSEESDKGRFKSSQKVSSLMKTPAIVVSPQTSLAEAIDVMVRKNIGRLPVVENGNLVGVLSRSDVIKFACG
ncbi:MAG: CBS domain-containing protein [Methanobacteriota archaeon]